MASSSSTGLEGSGSLVANLEFVTVALPASVFGRIVWQVTGTWVGTLTQQASIDGTNFNTYAGVLGSTGGTASTTAANDMVFGNVQGITHVRFGFTVFTSGTATVKWFVSLA